LNATSNGDMHTLSPDRTKPFLKATTIR
jgi:hypothetical protein